VVEMSVSANVRSIQALGEMKGALKRFRQESQQALNGADLSIRRTLEWLEERHRYWQREVRRRQKIVARARAALTTCQNSSYVNSKGVYIRPNCSAEERALLKAQLRLREAESELRNVRQWAKLVQQATTDYQRQAQRLTTFLRSDLLKATGLLDRSITILQSYAEMSGSSGGISVPTSSPSSTLADEEVEQQTNKEAEEHNPPLGPAMPPEIREGSIGGPERRG